MIDKKLLSADITMSVDNDEEHIASTGKTILFYEEIDEISALQVNKLLLSMDLRLQKKYRKAVRKAESGVVISNPIINLRIHSPGGDVFAALSIIDVISQLKSSVYTYVDGCAASGAAMIALSGKKRFIGKNGFMLFHQLSGSQSGKYADMQDEIKNSEKIMEAIRTIVKKRSKIATIEEVNDLLKHEWWMTADECISYGFVDKIVGKG